MLRARTAVGRPRRPSRPPAARPAPVASPTRADRAPWGPVRWPPQPQPRAWPAARPLPAAGGSTRAGRVSFPGGQSAMGAGALAAAAAAAGVAQGSSEGYAEEGMEGELMPVVEERGREEEHQG